MFRVTAVDDNGGQHVTLFDEELLSSDSCKVRLILTDKGENDIRITFNFSKSKHVEWLLR